jgi:hypothetical protein
MKCWHCNEELTWNNDFDIDEEDENYAMLTTLTCPNCDSLVEVYLPKEENERQD